MHKYVLANEEVILIKAVRHKKQNEMMTMSLVDLEDI